MTNIKTPATVHTVIGGFEPSSDVEDLVLSIMSPDPSSAPDPVAEERLAQVRLERCAGELGKALVNLVDNFPLSPDLLKALFGEADGIDQAVTEQSKALQSAMIALFNAGLGSQAHRDLYALYHDLGGNAT